MNTTSDIDDERDRLMTETNELEKTRSFGYDKNGNRTQVTDRNGRITDYIYDNLNRQTHERWLDENGQVVNEIVTTYDAADQVTAVSDAHSAYTFTYDALGYQDRVDNKGFGDTPQVVLDYDYDAEGKLESVTEIIEGVEGATTSYDYDERDQVTSITQSGNDTSDKRVEFDYSPTGQFEDIRRYSDVEGTQLVASTDYDYDEHNRLDRLAHSNREGAETAFYDFGYDEANRITQIIDVDGTTDYDYDQTHQLISADHSDVNNPDETYNYDKNGNRTQSSQHGNDYVTGANNQLETDGVYTYIYDDQGNMIRQEEIASGNIRTFEWNYRNRLVAVIDETAGVETQRVEYVYDVMGRRIAKTVDADGAGSDEAITTHFVYDRDNVSLEFVGQNATPTQRYLYGPQVDQVLAQEDNSGQTLWLLSDHLGTVKDLVDATGNILNHRTYDSYGNLIAQSNAEVSSRYGFTGREFDGEAGIHYYRARYYNSEIGQFISQDPIGFDGGDSNLYRYVNNSPIDSIDPSGLATFIVPGGGGEFGGLIISMGIGARYPVLPIFNPPGVGAITDPLGGIRATSALTFMEAFLIGGGGLKPCEPINIISHSDGNRVVEILLPGLKALNLPNEIHLGRLDPTGVSKPPSALASALDIGSNKPFSLDPRDILGALNPVDVRAPDGVSHMDLLNDPFVAITLRASLDI